MFISKGKDEFKVKIKKKNCILEVTFINRTDRLVLIPNLASRHKQDTILNRVYLNDTFISLINDTLLLNFKHTIKNYDYIPLEIRISDTGKVNSVTVCYPDIWLKKKNKQFIYLNPQYCKSKFKSMMILYDK